MDTGNKKFIVLDIGTTTLRCLILNQNIQVLGTAYTKIQLHYPKEGYVELDPKWLWENVITIINYALYDAKISAADITSIGISTQRSTFITWKKDTDEPFHNFITWKDVRSRELVKRYNNKLSIKGIRTISYLLYLFTRNNRFLLGSRLKIACNHVTSRLLWVLENIPQVREEIKKNNVMFGTLDTWLIYKLTKKATFVTDISNASATGFYDPFTKEWGSWAINILKIPSCILPTIVDNDFEFGTTDVFGPTMKIATVLGDQSASMIGSCCFDKNQVKVTIGTGSFININTGDSISCKLNGMYPLVCWKLNKKITYVTEAPCNDGGSLTEWMKLAGYIEDISDIDRIFKENNNNIEGLFFVPAFSGLGPPINDETAATGFIGIKPTTTKDQMALSILESIAFRIGLAFNEMVPNHHRTTNDIKKIRIDGGVARNDHICQIIADITNIQVERSSFQEISSLGVLFTCGMIEGLWMETKQLNQLRIIEKTFTPQNSSQKFKNKMKKWHEAAKRFQRWYE